MQGRSEHDEDACVIVWDDQESPSQHRAQPQPQPPEPKPRKPATTAQGAARQANQAAKRSQRPAGLRGRASPQAGPPGGVDAGHTDVTSLLQRIQMLQQAADRLPPQAGKQARAKPAQKAPPPPPAAAAAAAAAAGQQAGLDDAAVDQLVEHLAEEGAPTGATQAAAAAAVKPSPRRAAATAGGTPGAGRAAVGVGRSPAGSTKAAAAGAARAAAQAGAAGAPAAARVQRNTAAGQAAAAAAKATPNPGAAPAAAGGDGDEGISFKLAAPKGQRSTRTALAQAPGAAASSWDVVGTRLAARAAAAVAIAQPRPTQAVQLIGAAAAPAGKAQQDQAAAGAPGGDGAPAGGKSPAGSKSPGQPQPGKQADAVAAARSSKPGSSPQQQQQPQQQRGMPGSPAQQVAQARGQGNPPPAAAGTAVAAGAGAGQAPPDAQQQLALVPAGNQQQQQQQQQQQAPGAGAAEGWENLAPDLQLPPGAAPLTPAEASRLLGAMAVAGGHDRVIEKVLAAPPAQRQQAMNKLAMCSHLFLQEQVVWQIVMGMRQQYTHVCAGLDADLQVPPGWSKAEVPGAGPLLGDAGPLMPPPRAARPAVGAAAPAQVTAAATAAAGSAAGAAASGLPAPAPAAAGGQADDKQPLAGQKRSAPGGSPVQQQAAKRHAAGAGEAPPEAGPSAAQAGGAAAPAMDGAAPTPAGGAAPGGKQQVASSSPAGPGAETAQGKAQKAAGAAAAAPVAAAAAGHGSSAAEAAAATAARQPTAAQGSGSGAKPKQVAPTPPSSAGAAAKAQGAAGGTPPSPTRPASGAGRRARSTSPEGSGGGAAERGLRRGAPPPRRVRSPVSPARQPRYASRSRSPGGRRGRQAGRSPVRGARPGSHSPGGMRGRSGSPGRRRSGSPARRRSGSPARRRSGSPGRRRSPLRRRSAADPPATRRAGRSRSRSRSPVKRGKGRKGKSRSRSRGTSPGRGPRGAPPPAAAAPAAAPAAVTAGAGDSGGDGGKDHSSKSGSPATKRARRADSPTAAGEKQPPPAPQAAAGHAGAAAGGATTAAGGQAGAAIAEPQAAPDAAAPPPPPTQAAPPAAGAAAGGTGSEITLATGMGPGRGQRSQRWDVLAPDRAAAVPPQPQVPLPAAAQLSTAPGQQLAGGMVLDMAPQLVQVSAPLPAAAAAAAAGAAPLPPWKAAAGLAAQQAPVLPHPLLPGGALPPRPAAVMPPNEAGGSMQLPGALGWVPPAVAAGAAPAGGPMGFPGGLGLGPPGPALMVPPGGPGVGQPGPGFMGPPGGLGAGMPGPGPMRPPGGLGAAGLQGVAPPVPPPAPPAVGGPPGLPAGSFMSSMAAELLSKLQPSGGSGPQASTAGSAGAGSSAAGGQGPQGGLPPWRKGAGPPAAPVADRNNALPVMGAAGGLPGPALGTGVVAGGAAGGGLPAASASNLPAQVVDLVGSIFGQEGLQSVLSVNSRDAGEGLPAAPAAVHGQQQQQQQVGAPPPLPQQQQPPQQQQQQQQQSKKQRRISSGQTKVYTVVQQQQQQPWEACPGNPATLKLYCKALLRGLPSNNRSPHGMLLCEAATQVTRQAASQGGSWDGLLAAMGLPPLRATGAGVGGAAGMPAATVAAGGGAGSSRPQVGDGRRPGPGAAGHSVAMGEAYISPLLRFGTYRLSPQFPASAAAAGEAGTLSDTYCHGADPQWPLCLQDTQGTHADLSCNQQHWRDMQLRGAAARLQHLGMLLQQAGAEELDVQRILAAATEVLTTQQAAAVGRGHQGPQQQQQEGAELPASTWRLPPLPYLAAAAGAAAAGVEWRVLARASTEVLSPVKRGHLIQDAAAGQDQPVPAYSSLACAPLGSQERRDGVRRPRGAHVLKLQQESPCPLVAAVASKLALAAADLQKARSPFLNVWGRPLPGLDYVHCKTRFEPSRDALYAAAEQQAGGGMQAAAAAAAAARFAVQRRPTQRPLWQPGTVAGPAGGGEEAAQEGAAGGPQQGQQQQQQQRAVSATQQQSQDAQAGLQEMQQGFQADNLQHPQDWDLLLGWGLRMLEFDNLALPWSHLVRCRLYAASKAFLVGLNNLQAGDVRPVELLCAALPPIALQAGLSDKAVGAYARGAAHRPGCYQMWVTAAYALPRWQQQALFLMRGALSLAAHFDPQGAAYLSPTQEDSLRSSCIVDLVLRLMRTLVEAGQVKQVEVWLKELAVAAAQKPPVLKAALQTADAPAVPQGGVGLRSQRAAFKALRKDMAAAANGVLLQDEPVPDVSEVAALMGGHAGTYLRYALLVALHWRPLLAQVVWTALPHLQVTHMLPAAVEQRLGHTQRPLQLEVGTGLLTLLPKGGKSPLWGPFIPLVTGGPYGAELAPGQLCEDTAARMAAVLHLLAHHPRVNSNPIPDPLHTLSGGTQLGDLTCLLGQSLVVELGLVLATPIADLKQGIVKLVQARAALTSARQGRTGNLVQALLASMPADPLQPAPAGNAAAANRTGPATAAAAAAAVAATGQSECRRLQWQLLGVAVECLGGAVRQFRAILAPLREKRDLTPQEHRIQNSFSGPHHPFLELISHAQKSPDLVLLQPLWSFMAGVVLEDGQQGGGAQAALLLGYAASGLALPAVSGSIPGLPSWRAAGQAPVEAVRSAHRLMFDQQARAAFLAEQAAGHDVAGGLLLPYADGLSLEMLCWARLNAACFEALAGDPEHALQHFRAAAEAAAAAPPSQQHLLEAMWGNYLQYLASLAKASHAAVQQQVQAAAQALAAGAEPAAPAAAAGGAGRYQAGAELVKQQQEALAGVCRREKVALQCLLGAIDLAFSSSAGHSTAPALLLPLPSYGSEELKARLQPAPLSDVSHVWAAVGAVLSVLPRDQVVAVVEHVVELCPPSQQLAHLLLQQLMPHASDAAWVAWLLPLLLGAMVRSDPAPPLGEWLAVLRAVQVHYPGSLDQLLEVALQQHPWSDALWGWYVKEATSRPNVKDDRTRLAQQHGLMENAWVVGQQPEAPQQQQPAAGGAGGGH